jgi:hypothetical protein
MECMKKTSVLKVVFEPNIPIGAGRGGGNRGGFGGRGREKGRNPGDANEFENSDMDIVPNVGLEGDRVIHKRLSGSEGSDSVSVNVLTKIGRVAEQVNLLEYGNGVISGESPISTPQKVTPPKQQKKVMNGGESEDVIGSVTSSEEDRREP